MADEEGGTKIGRRPPPQQQPVQQQQQQQPVQQQPVQQVQQQVQQPRIQRVQQEIPREAPEQVESVSTFGKRGKYFKFNASEFKNAILVIVIFILLNSKMIWSQIQKFPMMGSMDPSMLALLVNSVIAGMSFYVISSFVIKN